MFPLRDSEPSGVFPVTCWLLILANLAVLAGCLSLGDDGFEWVILQFGLVPAHFYADPVGNAGTLLSSMFIHAGLWHFLGNMWFLHVFGDSVEARLGHGVFALFFLLAGLAGGALCVIGDPGAPIPTVGASGAVAGVLGAYLVWSPGARISTLVGFAFFWRVIPVRAWVFIGLWFLLQVAGWILGTGNVAWGAHVGGFAMGVAWALVDGGRPNRPDPGWQDAAWQDAGWRDDAHG